MCKHEGESLDYLEDAEVGQTIRFWYAGGSNPGYRTVEVTSVDKDAETVTGKTKERDGDFRTYNSSQASEISIVTANHSHDGELRIRFDEAGEKLLASLPANVLTALYSQYVAVEENAGVSFDEHSGEVVVKLVDKTPKVTGYWGDGRFEKYILQFSRGGKKFSIHNYGMEKFGVHNDVTGFDSTNVTNPNVLLKELQAFLA